jgi:anti-sigma factor RsiW
MNCGYMEVLISDYADGVSDDRTRRIVERHVQVCARCRQRLISAQQVAQQLRRLPALPAGVSSRVPRFRQRLEDRASVDWRRLEHYPFFVSALLAATLITLILLTVFYLGI